MKVRYLNCFFMSRFSFTWRILLLFNLFLICFLNSSSFNQSCSDFLSRTDGQGYLWIARMIITGILMIKSYNKILILSMQS